MDQLTFWSEAPPARHSAWPDSGGGSQTLEATFRSRSARLPITSTRSGRSGKTSLASSVHATTPLDAFWQDFAERVSPSQQSEDGQVQAWFLGRGARLPGAFSMLNFLEWPNAGGGSLCSLSEVLETGPVPPRFFLSPKACAGILRRAEKREKELPEQLKQALAAVAAQERPPLR